MDLLSNYVAILGVIALVLLYNSWRGKKNKSSSSLPPEIPGGLPLIGHVFKIGGKKPLCRIFSDIADKYGPMFMIRIGVHRTVVINNYTLIKEFFTTNDKFMCSRPKYSVGKYLGYNYAAFGFTPYGSFWRDMRKICKVEFLAIHKVKSMNHVLSSEVNYFIKDLFLRCEKNNNDPVKVDMTELFEDMGLNTITSMLDGKRYRVHVPNGRHFGEIVKEYTHVAAAFVPSDMVPFLGWMDFLGPVTKMKKIMKQMDDVLENWIQEHDLKLGSSHDNQNFIDVLLSTIQDDPLYGNSRQTIVKATVMAVILGGADETSITMIWLVVSLLKNRRILELAQQEIDEKVGRQRNVEESDIDNLVYVNAVIYETLRLFPAGPLAIPRIAIEDCSFNGYHIPKGTRFMTNLWKLHRDPNFWENPEEFKPERFLTSKAHLDHLGQFFEFLPFGSGRRSCPGLNLAMQLMQLTVARFLQAFNLSTPNNEPVDMTETMGITLSKKTPLHVMLTPRVAPHLYE